ncbi:MAG: hypothetical protein Q8M02_12440 [Candidatus Didemnitutus sp.]|nr:hypothetical protein [Candidatus Didemnitutus sp.]
MIPTAQLSARRRLSSERGSLLIVSLILAAIIGISIASYLKVGRNALTIANRALYNNAAINLAENGLEEAMYSINRLVADPSYSWTGDGWTAVGATAMRRKWTDTTFDQNATGSVSVYVYNFAGGAAPRIVARSSVTLGGVSSGAIEKWVEVQLTRTSKFANGLVAKDTIRFSGNNASVDSWNSDPDNNPATPAIPYSAAVQKANGSVGSISVSVNAVLVQNADIFGYVATGGAMPAVGSQGRIGNFGAAANTIDMARVSLDFSANFDAVTAPATTNYTLGSISNDLDLPRVGDAPAADGIYYYAATDIGFNNKTLAIKRRVGDTTAPNVIIKLSDATTSIAIGGGSGALNVETGANLQIYAPGDIRIAGNGAMNGGTTTATANQPQNLMIWGTKTAGVQDIQIAGNGALVGVIYAPQGSVKINGNGDVAGSVVANDITVVGNAAFHYDESLGYLGGNSPFRVTLWNELSSAASRAAYSSVLSF